MHFVSRDPVVHQVYVHPYAAGTSSVLAAWHSWQNSTVILLTFVGYAPRSQTYTIGTIVPVIALHGSFVLHTAFVIILIAACVWNGACFYIEVRVHAGPDVAPPCPTGACTISPSFFRYQTPLCLQVFSRGYKFQGATEAEDGSAAAPASAAGVAGHRGDTGDVVEGSDGGTLGDVSDVGPPAPIRGRRRSTSSGRSGRSPKAAGAGARRRGGRAGAATPTQGA